MEQTIFQLLDVENKSELRGAFNNQAGELITSIRAAKQSGSNCKAQENELATLILALFNELIPYHTRKDFKHRADPDDVVQKAAIKAFSVSCDPKYDIPDPYNYFSTILDNNFIMSAARGRHDTRFSELDGHDPDGANSAAASIVSRESSSFHEKNAGDIGEKELSRLLANNGFTPEEKAAVCDAIRNLAEKHRGWKSYQAKLEEYYFGSLSISSFISKWRSEREEKGEDKEGFNRNRIRYIKALHKKLESSNHELYENGLQTKLLAIEKHRRSRSDIPEVASKERDFISPTEMLTRLRCSPSQEMNNKLTSLITDILEQNPRQEIRLDDGLAPPAQEVFIPHVPERGGHQTFRIDSKAVGFIQQKLNYHHKRDDWLPLSTFNRLIGRDAHEKHRIETFEHFHELWKNDAKIPVDGTLRPVRDYVGFFTPTRGHHAEFITQMKLPEAIRGKEMYLSPLVKGYAQEHLPLPPAQEQKGWMRIRSENPGEGILQALHLSGRGRNPQMALATYLAVLMKIEELCAQKSITVGDPPVERPPKQLIGKFMVEGKHSPLEVGGIWLVHPDLVGEGRPINHDNILETRRAMLADPEKHPRFQAAITANDRGMDAGGSSGRGR